MANLKTDEKTYRASYAGAGEHNYIMEVKATEDGLEIDESVTVPWDWIFQALASLKTEDGASLLFHKRET
jgi:hypothetical protein